MTHPTIELRSKVFEALDNAVENGAIVLADLGVEPHLMPKQMAEDLTVFDADLERYTAAELRPHVEAWIKVKKT